MTRSITELQNSGVTFEAAEAVAIAQQLMAAPHGSGAPDEAVPPFGPPSADNVFVREDGSVVCRGCTATPAVSEIAIFLEALLGAVSPRVPGGLRYTVARALLNVEVPPFDSLDAFSQDLARHEQGDRAGLVRRALQRDLQPSSGRAFGQSSGPALRQASEQAPPAALGMAERRRCGQASASELRRSLREADARLFAQQHLRPERHIIDVRSSPRPGPPAPSGVEGARERSYTAVAACLAAGLALVGTGEFMHRRRAPVAPTPVSIVSPAVVLGGTAGRAAPEPPAPSTPLKAGPSTPLTTAPSNPLRAGSQRGVIRVRAAARPVPRREVAKRVKRLGAAPREPQQRGVMDRLKLGWLRRAFTVKSAL